VSGLVGGVNALVYTAEPLTMRRFEILPVVGKIAEPDAVVAPIDTRFDEEPTAVEYVAVATLTPFRYSVNAVPLLAKTK
jgi:hypothetical protein